MATITFTRKQYMNNECTHEQYYAQFATPEVVSQVKSQIGEAAIKASTDPHFNDIPLRKWDNLGISVYKSDMEAAGDYLTLAGKVCIAKAAARIIKDQP
jgi:hypothetical protein